MSEFHFLITLHLLANTPNNVQLVITFFLKCTDSHDKVCTTKAVVERSSSGTESEARDVRLHFGNRGASYKPKRLSFDDVGSKKELAAKLCAQGLPIRKENLHSEDVVCKQQMQFKPTEVNRQGSLGFSAAITTACGHSCARP